jgi:hypothetical protein
MAEDNGYFIIDNAFIEGGHLGRIKTLGALKVYAALRYHRNKTTNLAFPSTDTVAERTGLNRGNVSRGLRELLLLGLIEQSDGRHGRKTSRSWTFPNRCACATIGSSPLVAPAQRMEARPVAPAQQVETRIVAPAHSNRCAGAQVLYSEGIELHSPAARVGGRGKKAAGGAHPTSDHQALIEHHAKGWLDRRGEKYFFQKGKDGAAVKAILGACGGNLDKAKRVVTTYLDDRDPFIWKNGHTLSFLSGRINAYSSNGQPHPAPTVRNRVYDS